jgi:hypothetical protein
MTINNYNDPNAYELASKSNKDPVVSQDSSNENTISNSIENSTPLISDTENKVEGNTTPTFRGGASNSSSGTTPGGFLSNNANTLSNANKIPGYSLI